MSEKTHGKIISDLPHGTFAKLAKISPAGSLEVRKLASGTVLYWRVTTAGKSERVTIGRYDSTAPPKSLTPTPRGFSVQAGIRAAETLAQAHQANIAHGGHRGLVAAKLEAERKVQADKLAAERKEAERRQAAEMFNLAGLLTAYCNHQELIGRSSHADARSIFKLHIVDAFPALAATPANEVSTEQVAGAMLRLIDLGHCRTANKLRAFMAAAYSLGKSARSSPAAAKFKPFNIRVNPAAETAPDAGANKPDKNPLSAEELRAYWQTIKTMPGFTGAVLRLHLLTGGQRIEQLVRLKTSDVTGTHITLLDGKGRPGKPPRPHTVPLTPPAAVALLELKPTGLFALSTDAGKTHLAASTLSRWAVSAATGIDGFATKRIRSGVETLLASARIGTDIRGRLQSHGISGVQARHYDGHDYLDEKRHALETLLSLLERNESDNVVQFRAA